MEKSCRCNSCGSSRQTKPTAKGAPRLPTGWKRLNNVSFCSECWRKRYVLRAVTIPLAGPVGGDWENLRQALAQSWAESTGLANWAVTELAKADVVRSPGAERMPTMPHVYLYPGARKQFPAMSPGAVGALLHSVEQRYRKARLSVIWRAEANLPRYRYPVPYPIRKQGWKVRFGDDNVPLVDVTLGKDPVTLRLCGGPQFRRQLSAIAKLVSGDAVRCELSLYRQRANTGDHRVGIEDRKPGGGQRVHYRIMVKMTAWLPRDPKERERAGTLDVRTGDKTFLTATAAGRAPWILNADHVSRWIARHRRQIDRMAEDSKFEKQCPKRKRLAMTDRREKFVELHRRRLDSFCHESAAMLANYADRNGILEVRYDPKDKSYFPEFPWFKLQQLLAMKFDERGIQFVLVGEEGDTDEKLAA